MVKGSGNEFDVNGVEETVDSQVVGQVIGVTANAIEPMAEP